MTTVIILGAGLVAFVLFKMIQSATPSGFARQLAKTQLHCFYSAKNAYPQLPADELYQMTLQTRPGYDAMRVASIIASARSSATALGSELRLWVVVVELAAYEYTQRTKRSVVPVMNDICSGVMRVIPEHL